MHFSFKRWDLVATVLIIFPKMNWPIWQISCSFNVCLCFVWRIGGPTVLLVYATADRCGYCDTQKMKLSWIRIWPMLSLHNFTISNLNLYKQRWTRVESGRVTGQTYFYRIFLCIIFHYLYSCCRNLINQDNID